MKKVAHRIACVFFLVELGLVLGLPHVMIIGTLVGILGTNI
jgi:hypothetical protein